MTRVSAKKRGHITCHQTRAILPLPICLTVFDFVVAKELNAFLKHYASQVSSSYLECAIPGRQILDLTFSLSQVLEKAADQHGAGCVAQADIEKFYDFLQPTDIFQWLRRNDCPLPICASFLRLHCLPELFIRCGLHVASVGRRTRGIHTGARSSASAGRIPLLDIGSRRSHVFDQFAFESPGCKHSLASFVDNVFATGKSVDSALLILEDVETQLGEHWGLRYGADSRCLLPSSGQLISEEDDDKWPVKDHMKCLGQVIAANGSITEDWKCCIGCLWAAFFLNFRPALRSSPIAVRLRFLELHILSVLAFRWSRWPFTTSTLQNIDSIQNHFTRLLFPLPSGDDERPEAYFARRSHFTGRISILAGKWSLMWAKRVCSWFQHLQRGHDTSSWAPKLIQFQDADWLESRRGWQSSTQRRGTGTRLASGQPPKRWIEGHRELLRRGLHLLPDPPNRNDATSMIQAHVLRHGAF